MKKSQAAKTISEKLQSARSRRDLRQLTRESERFNLPLRPGDLCMHRAEMPMYREWTRPFCESSHHDGVFVTGTEVGSQKSVLVTVLWVQESGDRRQQRCWVLWRNQLLWAYGEYLTRVAG